jgi:hypothetical protein
MGCGWVRKRTILQETNSSHRLPIIKEPTTRWKCQLYGALLDAVKPLSRIIRTNKKSSAAPKVALKKITRRLPTIVRTDSVLRTGKPLKIRGAALSKTRTTVPDTRPMTISLP